MSKTAETLHETPAVRIVGSCPGEADLSDQENPIDSRATKSRRSFRARYSITTRKISGFERAWLHSLLKNSRNRPALSFLSFRRRTRRRNLRYRRALCKGRVWTTDAAVNEQDSSAVRRRNDKTGVCGFTAAEVVGVAERRFLANSSAEPQDRQNRLQPLRQIANLGNDNWVCDSVPKLCVGACPERSRRVTLW